jgi:glycosyltransferase involved in cell wall biosynthesis
MTFSIITVAFNSELTLKDTIESILLQRYTDIEYIIVDGLSIDNTLKIIKEYEPKFNGKMKWISERDAGIYDAMNKGLKMVTGDIVGFLNSDDTLADSTAISKIVNYFKTYKSADCVYADLYYVSRYNIDTIIRYWQTGVKKKFSKGWHPAHPVFYVRKDIYLKYGTFDLNYKLAADFELMLRFIEKNHIECVYLPEALVRMKLGGESNKNFKNIIKGNIECIKAFKKNNIPISITYPFYRLFPKLKQFINR